jgi:hypothetical protein
MPPEATDHKPILLALKKPKLGIRELLTCSTWNTDPNEFAYRFKNP